MNTSLHCVSLAAFCFHPLSDLAEPGAHRPLVPPSQTCCSRPARCTCRTAQAGKGFPLLRSWSPAWRRQPGACWMSPPRRGKPCPKQHRSWRSRGTGGAGAAGPAANPPRLAQQHPHPSALQLFPPFCTLASPFLAAQNRQREGKRLAGRFPQATENHGAQSWAELGDNRICFGDNPRAMWCDHAGLGVGVSF